MNAPNYQLYSLHNQLMQEPCPSESLEMLLPCDITLFAIDVISIFHLSILWTFSILAYFSTKAARLCNPRENTLTKRKKTIQTMVSGDQWQHHSESVEMKASTSGSMIYSPND